MRKGTQALAGAALAVTLVGVFAPAQVNISQPATVKTLADSATGAAPPANANFLGGNSSGTLAGIVACDTSTQLTISTATTTQMVALASGKSIFLCGFTINGGGSTTAKLVYGTGTNCATGTVTLTPAFSLATGTTVTQGGGLGYVAKTAAGNALCVTNSAAAAANVFVSFTQF